LIDQFDQQFASSTEPEAAIVSFNSLTDQFDQQFASSTEPEQLWALQTALGWHHQPQGRCQQFPEAQGGQVRRRFWCRLLVPLIARPRRWKSRLLHFNGLHGVTTDSVWIGSRTYWTLNTQRIPALHKSLTHTDQCPLAAARYRLPGSRTVPVPQPQQLSALLASALPIRPQKGRHRENHSSLLHHATFVWTE
jgi:hypothetical protein